MGAVQASPFAAAGAASGTNAPLTVGDVLPQLPPEIARSGALPPDQPVAISAQVLDDALRSGQAAVPMFEIYRVCPALFQTPVSPQDPRMIPLPASKLPRLIAAAQSGSQGGMAPPQAWSPPPMNGGSPFGAAQPQPGGGMMMEAPAPLAGTSTPSGMLLPPRRQGPPPPLAEVGSIEAPPQVSLPGAPAFPVSPFAAAGSEAGVQSSPGQPFAMGSAMGSSPFGTAPGAASPFGMKPEPVEPSAPAHAGSPFSAAPMGAGMPSAASPFSAPTMATAPAMPPSAAASPFGSASGQAPGSGGASPFGSLFGDKAVPTGQPAPDAPGVGPRMVTQVPMSMPPVSAPSAPSMAAPSGAGPVRISLAGMLKGYTAAELGFDPMVVPAWITTAMPASVIQELLNAPAPLAQLGFLVDGITDIGFRNVLNTARRDFQLRVDPEVLQNALAGNGAPPTLPNLSSLGPPPTSGPVMMVSNPPGSTFGGPKPGVMRVEPPPGFAAPPQQPSAGPQAFGMGTIPGETTPPGPGSPFLAPSGPLGGPAPAAAPMFGTPPAASPFQAPAPGPTAQPPSFQAIQPIFQPAPPIQPAAMAGAAPFGSIAFTPVAPPQDPFVAPTAPPAPAVQSAMPAVMAQPAPAPAYQPSGGVPLFSTPPPFGTPDQVQAPAPAAPFMEATVLPPEQKPSLPQTFASFSPPAAEPVDTGFSSDQLLGQGQPPPMLERTWSMAASAAASGSLSEPEPAKERPRPAPVLEAPAAPASFFDPPPAEDIPPQRAFIPPTFEDDPPAFRPPARTTPAPIPAPRPARPAIGSAGNSSLGVQTHDVNPDQIMLRALLDTDSDLTPQRVVELTCGLPGIAACVCLQGGQAISHAGAHKPQAREFQKQASQLAQHLRALAPLIGIEGAETFTMNSGDRLMTFCFPEGAILGVLHDAEPTLGLRDKITLIARELSRMIA